MARIPVAQMEARKRLLLRYIANREGSAGRIARIANADMMSDLELTDGQLRTVMLHLVDEGYVNVERCYAPNGAQIENAYRVTRIGKRFMGTK